MYSMLMTLWLTLAELAPKKTPRRRRSAYRLRLETLEDRALPSAYTAASVSDLITDITAANTAGGSNTITLTAPTTSPYVLTTWNAWTGDSGNGLPLIAANDNLTIVGNGDTIERSAYTAFRLLNVAPLASLTLENLTLQGGRVTSGVAPAGSEGEVGPSGGAIYNLGALTLSGVTVAHNETDGLAESGIGGGGIWSDGSLTLENGTLLQSNFAFTDTAGGLLPVFGGAVYVAGGTANISNTTFTGNEAYGGNSFGGALYVAAAQVILTNTTMNNNTALVFGEYGYGGGLYVAGGTVTLTNSTVESNVADNYGGGLYIAGGTVTLANDTVDSNTAFAFDGGGVYVAGGTVILASDTVESNTVEQSNYGGGIYIVSGATVYLDSFTVANTLNNTDGSGLNGSTANIDGPYIETPAAGQPPIVAHAASANPSPVTGTTTSLNVLGADAAGPASLTYTWAVTSAPAGAATPTFSSNGSNASQNTTATFYRAGTYTFQATITDPSGLTTVSSVTVAVVPTVTSLSVTPGNVTLANGKTQQFTATALDQFGQALASQPTFTWQVSSSSGGTISSTGLYTAPKKGTGTFQVEVSADGLNAQVTVTLT